MSGLDPVLVEVMNSDLAAVTEEMTVEWAAATAGRSRPTGSGASCAAGTSWSGSRGLGTSGLAGGGAGGRSRTVLNLGLPTERELTGPTHMHVDVRAGDRIFNTTPGSGGPSDPFLRNPGAVRADVIDQKIGVAGALARRGVVVDGERLVVDREATLGARTGAR